MPVPTQTSKFPGGCRAPLCECRQDIATQFRRKRPVSTPLIPDHSLQRLEAGLFPVLINPASQHDGQFLVRRAGTCFVLNGILTYRGPSKHISVVPTLMEEGRETVFCEWEEDLADKGHRNESAFDVHEDVLDHAAATSDTVDRFWNSYSAGPSQLDR